MALSKKHFIRIAAVLKDANENPDIRLPYETPDEARKAAVVSIASELSIMFKEENPNFDAGRFLAACGF
jgi:hypothetical protein